jgi:hypothetical protein
VTAAGEAYYVAGYYFGVLQIGDDSGQSDGEYDLFVAKLRASDGEVQWSYRAGGPGTDVANAVAVGQDGNPIVGGSFRDGADFGCGIGSTAGNAAPYLMTLDRETGACLEVTTYDATANGQVTALRASAAGEIWLAGRAEETVDLKTHVIGEPGRNTVFVCSLAPASGTIGDCRFIVADGANIRAIACDGDRIAAAGWFRGRADLGTAVADSSGGWDAFAALWDLSDGSALLATAGGPGSDFGNAVLLASDSVVVGGSFERTAHFGPHRLTSRGDADSFLWNLPLSRP